MSRRRLVIRSLLIALAVAAALVAAERTWRRVQRHRQRALMHSQIEALSRTSLDLSHAASTAGPADGHSGEPQEPLTRQEEEENRRDRERLERLILYHAAMKRKYESAAERPWLPVSPDPPPPE